jgi:hypothetical protein
MNINEHDDVSHSRSSTTHHHESTPAISSQDPIAVNRRSTSPDPRRRLIAAHRGHGGSARSPISRFDMAFVIVDADLIVDPER